MRRNYEKYGTPRKKSSSATAKNYKHNERTKESKFNRSLSFIRRNFEKGCGFRLSDLSSLERFTALLYQPCNSASLGAVRALFGLCMVIDVVEERGFADVDLRWGDPMECHFPLIHAMKPPSFPWMIVIYTTMWAGAFGIMLGFRFKFSCACFALPYWYIFLLDKSYWNNHTYLYGIVACLLCATDANKYLALDAKKNKGRENTVPLWNYFILRFQFFLLYFLAGLKKSSGEWLDGYAMSNLSKHWVFSPFKIFLTSEQTDFLIVHWFAFLFDLTVGFWMLFERTRIPAMVFCTAFHLMNSRLFSIGMFPYVCLATMPLFCSMDWPCRLRSYLNSVHACIFKQSSKTNKNSVPKWRDKRQFDSSSRTETNEQSTKETKELQTEFCSQNKMELFSQTSECNSADRILLKNGQSKVTRKKKLVVLLLLFHVILQFILPYSHFITKGYNNWVPGIYGYSWDMMVHTWETILVVIKVRDNINNEDHYLDSKAWVQSDRWEKHGDMARQYAFCIKDNLMKQKNNAMRAGYPYETEGGKTGLMSNLSIYIDVWCSLNGRFQQRMFNSNVDLLTVDWHPLRPISFLMPLLSQYNSYRHKLEEIQEDVYTWSNETDVLFVADFPGMELDNYISGNFTNVSLTVLEGKVTYVDDERSVILNRGSSMPIKTRTFHKVRTTSSHPACYMYTYNHLMRNDSKIDRRTADKSLKEEVSLLKEINYKLDAWTQTLAHIANAFFYFVYDVPMIRRVPADR